MSLTEITPQLLGEWPLPEPGQAAGKEGRGRILVAGSSAEVPGATLLAGLAALRAGAGKLRLAVPQDLAVSLGVAAPEARVYGLACSDSGELAIEPANALA